MSKTTKDGKDAMQESMPSVQRIKAQLSEKVNVGQWFDVGRVDRLEWRLSPEVLSVLAVEWSYAKDEITLRVQRKVRIAGERYRWVEGGRMRIHAISWPRDMEAWWGLLLNEVRAAGVGDPIVLTELKPIKVTHQAAKANEPDQRKAY